MRKTGLSILVSIAIIATETVFADEAYIVRFNALGKSSGCRQAMWSSDAVFYNESSASANVRLLDISNGELEPGAPTIMSLAPGQAQAASQSRIAARWAPRDANALSRLWVMHLDVSSGVLIESRDEVSEILSCIPDSPPGPFIKTSMPVFRSLVPAGTPQVKLGTDLGVTPARQNVAIYNAADQTATATIQVRRTCDNEVVDSRTVTIAPRAIMQFGGFATGSNQCTGTEVRTNSYVRYTVITVDQPSFSLVSTLTESQPEVTGDIVPLIEFGVK